MKRLRVILLAVLAMALLVTAGCDPNNEKGTPGGSSAAISGNSGAYPNIYTATFKLRDVTSASWGDGSIDDKTIEWKIIKKE